MKIGLARGNRRLETAATKGTKSAFADWEGGRAGHRPAPTVMAMMVYAVVTGRL